MAAPLELQYNSSHHLLKRGRFLYNIITGVAFLWLLCNVSGMNLHNSKEHQGRASARLIHLFILISTKTMIDLLIELSHNELMSKIQPVVTR